MLFPDKCSIEKHIADVHEKKRPNDDFVDERNKPTMPLDFKTSLNKPSTITKRKKSFECKFCGNNVTQKGSLNRHINMVHERQRPIQNPLDCQLCEKNFPNKSSLNDHIATIHEEKKLYDCQICNAYVSYNIWSLDKHIAEVHESMNSQDNFVDKTNELTFDNISNIDQNTENIIN